MHPIKFWNLPFQPSRSPCSSNSSENSLARHLNSTRTSHVEPTHRARTIPHVSLAKTATIPATEAPPPRRKHPRRRFFRQNAMVVKLCVWLNHSLLLVMLVRGYWDARVEALVGLWRMPRTRSWNGGRRQREGRRKKRGQEAERETGAGVRERVGWGFEVEIEG